MEEGVAEDFEVKEVATEEGTEVQGTPQVTVEAHGIVGTATSRGIASQITMLRQTSVHLAVSSAAKQDSHGTQTIRPSPHNRSTHSITRRTPH